MSKLIVEMELPKHMCCDCEISIDGFACKKSRTNGGKCPIVGVLPDEHGDLIDRDALMIELMDRGIEGVQTDDLAEFQQIVMDAKAVIAAERKDDEQIH